MGKSKKHQAVFKRSDLPSIGENDFEESSNGVGRQEDLSLLELRLTKDKAHGVDSATPTQPVGKRKYSPVRHTGVDRLKDHLTQKYEPMTSRAGRKAFTTKNGQNPSGTQTGRGHSTLLDSRATEYEVTAREDSPPATPSPSVKKANTSHMENQGTSRLAASTPLV